MFFILEVKRLKSLDVTETGKRKLSYVSFAWKFRALHLVQSFSLE